MKRIAIIGAGGHGRVVASILQAQDTYLGESALAGFIDKSAGNINGIPVLGHDEDLHELKESGVIDHFIVGLGSIRGGSQIREGLFNLAISAGLKPATAIHPAAILSKDVSVGAGTVIMPGCIINTGSTIGENSIINTGAILDHDARIGRNVHIAPGCTLSGNVTVGDQSLIGVGSTVMQGIDIEAGVTVGAGSVVVTPIPGQVTAFGNPARIQ